MLKNEISAFWIAFLLFLSIIGLAFVPFLLLQSNLDNIKFPFLQNFVGAFFITLCLLGAVAVFYPTKCRDMLEKTQNPIPQANKVVQVQIKGHHPDCQKFSGNVIKIKGKMLCAACSGLLIGDIIVLTGTVLYFFVGFNLWSGSSWLLGLGEMGVLLGLAQIKLAGYFKVFANVVFVFGAFIILVVTDFLVSSFMVDLYVLGLVTFLLWFRILLSEWNNKRICQACQSCFQ